ncbi:nuclear transport factor 2 family protein [Algimonas porphyrae]|uniref:SnoaL-like domain-containing protein n=1 Tax=Algimonas porphyrae TaxID=1128113 RepID=A0ABQ5UVV9_9PROT|nr:nuclear transport factor 2 family protein [Algimonas porphyrae]GLQ19227.1 hypothetical protein GCM10007854_01820 [Algimonas porphyrae]
MTRAFLIGLIGFVLVACAPTQERADAPDFSAALQTHLKSVQDRDLETYLTTITDADALPLIFPNGEIMSTRAAVVDFHTNWFADPDWRMEFDVIGTIVGDDMAVATLRTEYRDTPDGTPRAGILGLVFQLQNGSWRLIHDQNTRIVTPT